MGAFPYIIIGIVVAMVATLYSNKAKNDKHTRESGEEKKTQTLREWLKSNGMFSVSLSMYAVSFMMWMDKGDSTSPISFFCLGSAFLCLGAAGQLKKKDNEKV